MPKLRTATHILENRVRTYAVGAGLMAAGTGAFHLVAWFSGVMVGRGVQSVTMKANSALCLILCGSALALIAGGNEGAAPRLTSRSFAALATSIGILTLLEHLGGWDFGIDQLLANELSGALGTAYPNRMGPPGALSMVLAGSGLLLLASRREQAWRIAQQIAVLLCLIPLLGLLGYLYGAQELYGGRHTGIAWMTTLALVLMATGMVAARPGTGLMARAIAADPGGQAIRRLLPAAFLIPILLGWLRVRGEWAALYDHDFGDCLLVLSWIVVFSFLVYHTGSWLSRSAQATRISEEKFAKAFASSPAAMVITSVADGTFLEVNDSWQEMFGYQREEILQRSALEFGLWRTPGERERAVGQLRGQGSLRNLELVLCNRAGEELVALSSAELLSLGGELVGLWSHVDITDRKRNEEELRRAKVELEKRVRERTQELEMTYSRLQSETEERVAAMETLRRNEQLLLQQSRLAAMGEMIGNIAHQWRQPLNNLGLVLQGLPVAWELGEFDDQVLGDAVEKSMRLLTHMSQTIDDFSSFLQPDKEKKRFSVNQAVGAALTLFEATLKRMEVDLQFRAHGEVTVEGYRNEFTQVIMNLITNARDALREKGTRAPKLVIELFRVEGRSVITVTDNAGGIPEEIREKIFDPYFTTKGPDRGTGIGLFMSKNIIEKSMNGSLTFSNRDGGAQFRIEV